MKNTLTFTLAALALAASGSALAQAASAPAKVAVSASDAAVAQKKAVPQAETGTVVRTGPDATDKAKSMTKDHDAGSVSHGKKTHAPAGGASRAAPAKAD